MNKRAAIVFILGMIMAISGGCTPSKTPGPESTGNPARNITPNPAWSINPNPNINVMVARTANWEKFVSEPVVSKDFLKRIDGSTATVPVTAELYRQFYDYPDKKINNDVNHATTHQAYLNLINKEKDIIFVTEPSNEELALARKKNVKLEVKPITLEAFVFIVNDKNPVSNLSVSQIQDIYTGKYKNWTELGIEKGKTIYAFQRKENSGSQTAMKKLVMKDKKLTDGVQTMVIEDMGMLIYEVANYQNKPGAIGYTYKYYLNNLYKQEGVKILNVDGVLPDKGNLLNGSYPFTTNYYAVIRSDEPEDSPARKLRDWLLTDEGQRLVKMCGYDGMK